jgi:hypothetical protein
VRPHQPDEANAQARHHHACTCDRHQPNVRPHQPDEANAKAQRRLWKNFGLTHPKNDQTNRRASRSDDANRYVHDQTSHQFANHLLCDRH